MELPVLHKLMSWSRNIRKTKNHRSKQYTRYSHRNIKIKRVEKGNKGWLVLLYPSFLGKAGRFRLHPYYPTLLSFSKNVHTKLYSGVKWSLPLFTPLLLLSFSAFSDDVLFKEWKYGDKHKLAFSNKYIQAYSCIQNSAQQYAMQFAEKTYLLVPYFAVPSLSPITQ